MEAVRKIEVAKGLEAFLGSRHAEGIYIEIKELN